MKEDVTYTTNTKIIKILMISWYRDLIWIFQRQDSTYLYLLELCYSVSQSVRPCQIEVMRVRLRYT